MSCVGKVCLCSSNSCSFSTDSGGCNRNQMVQDIDAFASARGIPVVVPAGSFTSFTHLISYKGKEEKKYCRWVFRARWLWPHAGATYPHSTELLPLQPWEHAGRRHIHCDPLGGWEHFPFLTLCFPKMGMHVCLWKRSLPWALVPGGGVEDTSLCSPVVMNGERIHSSQRQLADR